MLFAFHYNIFFVIRKESIFHGIKSNFHVGVYMKGQSFAKRGAFFFCSVDRICSGQSSEFVSWTAIDKEKIFYEGGETIERINNQKLR